MNILFIIIAVILSSILTLLLYKLFFEQKTQTFGSIDPDRRTKEMALVYESINQCILKTLFEFTMEDIHFSKDSPVQILLKNHYRDLITFLLRTDIFIDRELEDKTKERVIFFNYFFQKVYLFYISETNQAIKNLFFKYYSGFSIETYGDKKAKPQILPFLINYVRLFLWKKFYENEKIQSDLLDELNANHGDPNDYSKQLTDYDYERIKELSLNIYNMVDSDVKYGYSNTMNRIPDAKTEKNKEVKNEFSVSFNEQSK